jgi:prolyl-tRNA editing enzyme YbaK/EbsC (Cys-tRNA(Pro) deacylase)
VTALLQAAGCTGPVRMLDGSTRTAAEAAAALEVDVANIAKTLVFVADGAPVVVVAGGASRVDTARLAGELAASTVDKADADTVRTATGYPIGGVSPVGLPDGLTVLVDGALAPLSPIWAAAGHPRAVYRTTFDELVAVSGGRVVDVAER